ncbi:hypothetical protein CALCODRAFT_487130 [Calocera cornea HHB12733]|uniref:Uncharacterized protein n=1 Tax=Calocera cornea HHB12733 TaxID=1353952 RepID=A0A165DB46_9BASI|nr:hypothetical protein CALCODRAFT_487130 [Calocera cornea HHB12733]
MAAYAPAHPYPIATLMPPPLAYATVPLVPVWEWTALSNGPVVPNPYGYQYAPAPAMTINPTYPPQNWNTPPTAAGNSQTMGSTCSCCTALLACVTSIVQLVGGGGC